MANLASMGWATQLGTRDESTYGTLAGSVNERFCFISESIAKRGVIVERDGLRGTRSHQSDDTRTGPYIVGGQLVLEPTPQDLVIWLPRILGAAASGTTFALADLLPSFSMSIDRVAKVFTYVGCKVNRATFSGAKGQLLRLVLDIIGQKEGADASGTFTEGAPGAAASFPSLTSSITQPFIFSDLVLTLQAVARNCEDFELTIDNALVGERFFNSLTIVDLPEGDRMVSLKTTHDYNSTNADLYAQALAGAAGTMKWRNPAAWAAAGDAGYGAIWTFAALQVPPEAPVAGGKGPIPLVLNMTSRMASTTKEVSVVLDSTA